MDEYRSPGPFRIIPDRDDPWTFDIIERRHSFKDNHNCDNTASTRPNQYHHGQTRQHHAINTAPARTVPAQLR
ncbi:hypothetical protein DPMN_052809 [Dreissena polymorpha]|uniref:Uncharacterized protein n=1 Tax=Dreissena polymorpha TaxID=45954 RepID=A0A9D4CL26_DREPO|nr:hypothetical protein DPMN_052809 [Dreissena polymorpha]